MRHEAPGVLSVELRPQDGAAELPAFEAGAHLDLHLPNGMVRSYSLINPATERHRYVVAVQEDRQSRGGSRYVHRELRVGAPCRSPRRATTSACTKTRAASVLVAGGIGVTPLLAMLRRLASLRRPVDFYYCARSRRMPLSPARLEALAGDEVRLHWHFDDEAGAPPDLRRWLADRPRRRAFLRLRPRADARGLRARVRGAGLRERARRTLRCGTPIAAATEATAPARSSSGAAAGRSRSRRPVDPRHAARGRHRRRPQLQGGRLRRLRNAGCCPARSSTTTAS